MSLLDGTNPVIARQQVVDTLLRQGYRPSGPDGFRHPDGEFVTVGYAGRSLRIRRYAPDDRKRTRPDILDMATCPDPTELALFLGEGNMTTAPKLSRAEQIAVALFDGVQVVLEHAEAKLPTRGFPGDAGADLYTSERTVIQPGTFRDVPTGIRLGLPAGYWARITGRSSTLRRRGLLCAEGVIDSGYTGPIFAGVWNLADEPRTIEVGERVAQIILHRIEALEFQQATDIVSVDGRNASGFGSSGR